MKITRLMAAMLLTSGMLAFSSCSSNNGNGSNDTSSAKDQQQPRMGSTREDLYEAYIDVKNALVTNNAEGAQKEAKDILTELDKVKADNMAAAEKASWPALSDQIRASTNKIIGTADIKLQRAAFDDLSKQMFTAINKYGVEHETAYKQYCPMAFDNKGAYWLSEEQEIKNPYFGNNSEMAHCGADSGTLAKNGR